MWRKRPSLVKGLITGAVAGIAATLVMDQFLSLAGSGQKAFEKQKKRAEGESDWVIAHEQAQKEMEQQSSEGSTEKVARKVAEAAGTQLPQEQRKAAGQAVHYTFGTLMGVAYSVIAEWLPEVTTGNGAAFGSLLFVGADEIAVPALRLSPPPTETPATDQVQHWAAHVVYGSTLEIVRGLVRRWV